MVSSTSGDGHQVSTTDTIEARGFDHHGGPLDFTFFRPKSSIGKQVYNPGQKTTDSWFLPFDSQGMLQETRSSYTATSNTASKYLMNEK